jgi:hypothetical protein
MRPAQFVTQCVANWKCPIKIKRKVQSGQAQLSENGDIEKRRQHTCTASDCPPQAAYRPRKVSRGYTPPALRHATAQPAALSRPACRNMRW